MTLIPSNKQYLDLFGPGLLPQAQRFDPELMKLFWDISINKIILEVLEIFRKNVVEIAKRSKECHEVSQRKSAEETAALRRIEPITQSHAPHFLHFHCLVHSPA